MILKVVEGFKGGEFGTPPLRPGAVGMEVPVQSHGPRRQAGRCAGAMEVAHLIQEPILIVHQPINPICCAGRSWKVIGDAELCFQAAQLPDGFLHRAVQMLSSPLTQPPKPLRELHLVARPVNVPRFLAHLVPQTPVSEEGMVYSSS